MGSGIWGIQEAILTPALPLPLSLQKVLATLFLFRGPSLCHTR